ncbi:MAG: hypothetical protein KJZ69_09945 [Phycisphaerales bacterium]|nr:hypothetical protein [Phycisphaerales bacterium]
MLVPDADDAHARFNLFAPILAWIVPGLGHWFLGHRRRARLIAAGIAILYFGGLLLGGLGVIDRQQKPLWFYGQLLVGPATPIINAWHAAHYPPKDPTYSVNHAYARPSFSHSHEIPTLFTTVAGMLNLLAILDVIFLPRFRREQRPAGPPGGVERRAK